MAVEQHRDAEPSPRPLDQSFQLRVVGLVERLDPTETLRDRNWPPVDRLGVAHDSGNRAKPDGYPERASVCELGKATLENLRIEFIGLAVEIEISAWKQRPQQRRADRNARQKQLVDESVFRAAQRQRIQAGRIKKALGIDGSGMGRTENKRRSQMHRLDRLEGRIEVFDALDPFHRPSERLLRTRHSALSYRLNRSRC